MRARPVFARLLLRIFLPVRDREFILGDLDEEYDQRRESATGRFSSWLWYWRQALASLMSEVRYEAGAAAVVATGEPKRGSMIDTLRQDVRYAWRSLNQRPAFTAVAVITLALGIGANTGIFSIANWLLLRPVPGVKRVNELALVEFEKGPGQTLGISWSNYTDLVKSATSFRGLAGSVETQLQVRSERAPARAVRAEAVGGDFFGLLGVPVRLGRAILPQETAPGQNAPFAVISERLWRELYQSDPKVIGRSVRANKGVFTVVGVVGGGFQGIYRSAETDVWVPYSMYAQLRHMDEKYYHVRGTGIRLNNLIVRLKPGVTAEQAQADVQRVLTGLIQQYPDENEIYRSYPARLYAGIGVAPLVREHTSRIVRLMLLIVAFLLVISTANVANMLFVRGVQKRPEAAVRRALGASTGRLARQLLTESVLLALMGGATAVVVAGAFLKLVNGGRIARTAIESVPMDLRVLAFTLMISIIAGLVFGFAPLSAVRRLDLNTELHGASSRHTRSRVGLRNAIVVLQVSLSLVLVIGALLLGRTLNALLAVDLGFSPDRLAGLQISVEPQAYTAEQVPRLGARLLEAAHASNAVEAAALTYTLPLTGVRRLQRVTNPANPAERIGIEIQNVSENYFRTLGVPILRGRPIEQRDWVGARQDEINIVLSETAAKRVFGSRDPLGATLSARSFTGELTMHVVGIAADARSHSLIEPMPPVAYWPFHTVMPMWFSLLVRSRGAPAALESELQRALASVDPNIPLEFRTVSDNIRKQIAERQMLATTFYLFSALAVLLAAVGLYGVLGTAVNERRREFGIRLALGADPQRILSLVVAQSARIIVVGLVLGITGAVWLSRLLQAQLYGVNRFSGEVYLVAAVIFGVAALIATAIPTRAATRIEPTTALRQE